MMNHDRVLIRAKDIGLVIGILTLGGMVWKMYEKPTVWDQAVKDISEMKPMVQQHEKQLAVLVAAVVDIKENLIFLRKRSER